MQKILGLQNRKSAHCHICRMSANLTLHYFTNKLRQPIFWFVFNSIMYCTSLARQMCEYDLFWRHPSLLPLKPNGVKTDWPDRRGGQSDRPHIVSRISHIHLSGPCVQPERNGESKGIEGQAVLAAPFGWGGGWWGPYLTYGRGSYHSLFVVKSIKERITSAFSISFLGAICTTSIGELYSQTISIMCLAAPMWTQSGMLNKLSRPSITHM